MWEDNLERELQAQSVQDQEREQEQEQDRRYPSRKRQLTVKAAAALVEYLE
jgi:hypothetical protein